MHYSPLDLARICGLALALACLPALTSCALLPANDSPAPGQSLTPPAQTALEQARAHVLSAQAQRALWVSAREAMELAETAAQAGDSAAVLRHSATVVELVRLGLAQQNYPPVSLP